MFALISQIVAWRLSLVGFTLFTVLCNIPWGTYAHWSYETQGAVTNRMATARTKLRSWSEVMVERCPLNGLMIRIAMIGPDEMRQILMNPCLEVRMDYPGMKTFDIPMRIAQEGERS